MVSEQATPVVIQGGMGVAVSGWRLARAVARLGQLGVVSGTALDVVHARRLGDGDPGGHLRRAYERFPVPAVAERVLQRWFISGGRAGGQPYRAAPRGQMRPSPLLRDLTVVANFAEIWLAKEGHDGTVGVNYLQKIQLPTPHALYGALLAGVDYVLMGAGIPAEIPRLLTDLARGVEVSYPIDVIGADRSDDYAVRFDPAELLGSPPELRRPPFLAIIASNTLAAFLARDPTTAPDGFVVEGPCAGGHNAPPRGRLQLDDRCQPLYGPRDEVDPDGLVALGLPFWLAGGYAHPERVRYALGRGAAGVQIGTAFALCEESALLPSVKQELIRAALAGEAEVFTDPNASPSGYPFKVAAVAGTLSDAAVYAGRRRVCDLGYLRSAYKKPDGTVGYRCPSEPVRDFVGKGGTAEETVGRKCLCNGLLAAVGYAQVRSGGVEPPIVTIGDDLVPVTKALAGQTGKWRAADVVDYLLPGRRSTKASLPDGSWSPSSF